MSEQAEKALKCGYPLSSVDSRLAAEVLFLEYFTYTGYLYSGLSRGGIPGVTTPGPGQKGARAHVLYLGHKLLLKTNKNFTNLQSL